MKFDIKTIFILVLGVALVLMFIFRPSKDVDTYEDEINSLKEQNKNLEENNDSLHTENEGLNVKLVEITTDIIEVDNGLDNNSNNISDLEDEKGKVSDRVRVLNADGVAGSLTSYLNRR